MQTYISKHTTKITGSQREKTNKNRPMWKHKVPCLQALKGEGKNESKVKDQSSREEAQEEWHERKTKQFCWKLWFSQKHLAHTCAWVKLLCSEKYAHLPDNHFPDKLTQLLRQLPYTPHHHLQFQAQSLLNSYREITSKCVQAVVIQPV